MSKKFKLPKDVHSSDVFGQLPSDVALEAIGLWAVAGSYARRHDTGGHIPEDMLKVWNPAWSAVDALAAIGVCYPVNQGDQSYQFTDWED